MATAWISEHRAAVALLVIVAIAMFAMRGCSGYAEVNQRTYDFAQSLLQTALRRDDPRTGRTRAEGVAAVKSQMTAALAADQISSDEAALLSDIIQLTEAGRWNDARTELRSLLESQVR